MSIRRVHLLISGSVQGVGFRYAARRQASQLRLVGWVRNRHDGRVEVVAEGDERTINDLIAWCRHGPPGSWVDDVNVDWEAPAGAFSAFDIAPTG